MGELCSGEEKDPTPTSSVPKPTSLRGIWISSSSLVEVALYLNYLEVFDLYYKGEVIVVFSPETCSKNY